MFLTETNTAHVAIKQYFYKLKVYIGLFYYLILFQLIILVLSLSSINRTILIGSDYWYYSYLIRSCSGDMEIKATMICTLVIAIIITTKEYKNLDFTFVSNRFTSGISSIIFLLTYSIIGGVTASLSGILLRVILYFTTGSENIVGYNFVISPYNLIINSIAIFLYLILISSWGYLIGTLIQLHKSFIILVPMYFICLLYFESFSDIFSFFSSESLLSIFSVKVILTATVFFLGGMILSNRIEVRK